MAVHSLRGCPELHNFKLGNVVEWAFFFPFCFEAVMLSLRSWLSNLFLLITFILHTYINENIHDTENDLLMSQEQNPPYCSDYKKTLVQKEQTRLLRLWSHILYLNIEEVRLSESESYPTQEIWQQQNQQLIQIQLPTATTDFFFMVGINTI